MKDRPQKRTKIRTRRTKMSHRVKEALLRDHFKRLETIPFQLNLGKQFEAEILRKLLDSFFKKKALYIRSRPQQRQWAERLYGKDVFLKSLKNYRWSDIELLHNGRRMDLSEFAKHSTRIGSDDKKVARFLKKKNTGAIVRTLQNYHPEVKKSLSELSSIVGAKNVNAYVSLSEGRIFEAHWDPHDVLMLQTYGSKKWQVKKGVVELPLAYYGVLGNAHKNPKAKSLNCQLTAGSALYIPRGYWHRGLGKDSIHLSFGLSKTMVARVIGRMVLDALVESFNDVDLRQELDSIRNADALYGKIIHQLLRKLKKDLNQKLTFQNFEREVATLKKRPKPTKPDTELYF